MIFQSQNLKVLVHRVAIDMRKGHNGLSAIVENTMKGDLMGGSIFLFVNKSRRLCKAIYFDGTGMVIIHKRLDAGKFMHFYAFEETQEITLTELSLIFEGSSLKLPLSPKKIKLKND